MNATIESNARCNEAETVLAIIRRTHDTTSISSDRFAELCRAAMFYLKGGFSPEVVAGLVIEEVF